MINVYFQSKEHEERFNNFKRARNCITNDVLAFCYLATSDLIFSKSNAFMKIEKNEIKPKRLNWDNTPYSTTQIAIGKLAFHLYSPRYKAPNLYNLLCHADPSTKRLILQAIELF